MINYIYKHSFTHGLIAKKIWLRIKKVVSQIESIGIRFNYTGHEISSKFFYANSSSKNW